MNNVASPIDGGVSAAIRAITVATVRDDTLF